MTRPRGDNQRSRNVTPTRHAALVALLLLCAPAAVFAQQDPNAPDASKIKVRFGPVLMNPSVTVGNVGVDENVFNERVNPKRDFTLTVSPRTEVYLPFLGTWFTGTVLEDLVWYQEYSSERQANTTYGIAWRWPLARFTVNSGASHTNTRERPGYEIDERAQRALNVFTAGVSYPLTPNTGLEFGWRRDTTDYDLGASFNAVNLRDELNVETTGLSLGVRQRITPLTSVTFSVNRQQDRYPFNSLRDSDRTEARLSVAFDPVALLKGGVSIGYTDYTPLVSTIPKFTGATLSASLSYTFLELTKVALTADRQVQNSYDINQPYFIQSGGGLELTQQVFGRLDFVVRGGIENLAYQDRVGATVAATGRTDHLVRYGGGIGYHKGKNLRIGVNYDQTRRESVIDPHSYERPSFGTSLTYDF